MCWKNLHARAMRRPGRSDLVTTTYEFGKNCALPPRIMSVSRRIRGTTLRLSRKGSRVGKIQLPGGKECSESWLPMITRWQGEASDLCLRVIPAGKSVGRQKMGARLSNLPAE